MCSPNANGTGKVKRRSGTFEGSYSGVAIDKPKCNLCEFTICPHRTGTGSRFGIEIENRHMLTLYTPIEWFGDVPIRSPIEKQTQNVNKRTYNPPVHIHQLRYDGYEPETKKQGTHPRAQGRKGDSPFFSLSLKKKSWSFGRWATVPRIAAASALVSRGSLAINYFRPTCIETSFDAIHFHSIQFNF